jgi:hypothetical protein
MNLNGAQILQVDLPDKLDGFWVHICVKPHNDQFAYLVSAYKNDKYPTGTIIISEELFYDYPDMYVCLDKNYYTFRIYTNPIHRRQGYWIPLGIFFKHFFSKHFKVELEASPDRSKVADLIYNQQRNVGGQDYASPILAGGRIEREEMEPPRDPAFPLIWFGQRIGGFNE